MLTAEANTFASTPRNAWLAELTLDYAEKLTQGIPKTIVARRKHKGPLTVQRAFYPEQDVCHSYLLHPPAGITANDQLAITANLGERAKVLITTPGATRFYRTSGIGACLDQRLKLGTASTLEWLPQETLIYARAKAKINSEIKLTQGAHYFGWEVIGLGRPASGEIFDAGSFELCTQIFRDGRLCIRDRMQGNNKAYGLQGKQAFGTLYASGADPETLDTARELCRSSSLISAPSLIEDFLVIRAIADECNPITELFREIWQALRPYLFDRTAQSPQIWRT